METDFHNFLRTHNPGQAGGKILEVTRQLGDDAIPDLKRAILFDRKDSASYQWQTHLEIAECFSQFSHRIDIEEEFLDALMRDPERNAKSVLPHIDSRRLLILALGAMGSKKAAPAIAIIPIVRPWNPGTMGTRGRVEPNLKERLLDSVKLMGFQQDGPFHSYEFEKLWSYSFEALCRLYKSHRYLPEGSRFDTPFAIFCAGCMVREWTPGVFAHERIVQGLSSLEVRHSMIANIIKWEDIFLENLLFSENYEKRFLNLWKAAGNHIDGSDTS